MKNVMGVIYTGEKDSFLRELTLLRAIAAMPVAGRYRVIDFLVSSMVGSGMRNVGVIMQKNYHSLMDHLGSGKEWDLHGKNDGLYILPPFLTRDNVGVYNGSLDALHSNMNYLRRSRQEYVLLCNSLIVFNANFTDMFKSYLDSGCDVMMLYTKDPEMQRPEYGTYLDIDATGKVVDIEIDPTKPRYENTSMDVILLRKDLLIDLVDRGAAHGYHDLVRDELPARYMDGAWVLNSMVADGCIIDGMVEHSVLFRGVKIDKGAHVKNCIIMQDCHIEEGVQLENCILDKQAVIKHDGKLIGPSAYPIVISKNMII